MTTKPFAPDYTIPPGQTLRARLEEIDLSQSRLAARSGLSTKHINQIVQGVAPISHETALILERVTEIPAGVWNRLESTYREAQLRQQPVELSAADREWIDKMPVAALRRRGRLAKSHTAGETYQALLAFFGVADREAWNRTWLGPVASFKRTKAFKSEQGAVAAWLRLGELAARSVRTAPYDATRFRAALVEARALTRAGDLDALVPLCAAAGVAVVFEPEIAGARASGATWWASPTRAVILLSDRYKREDHLWFGFFHEAGHVLLHSKKETFIDDGSENDEVEEEANRFATDLLIPPSSAGELSSLSTEADVQDFAARLGVADGVVVGRLQHDRLWGWNKGNGLRRKVRIVRDS